MLTSCALHQGRELSRSVPEGELEVVEDGFRLRKAAAQDCIALLATARADLAKGKAAGHDAALKVTKFGLCSAYRDYDHDMRA